MTSTPTTRARLMKQGYQDNPESWGTELNSGVIERVDDARGQWVTKALTGDYTLDVQNYIQDEARAPMLRFTGTGSFTVTAPAVSYWYIVRNDCTGDLTLKRSGGTGAVIRAGTTAIWTTDGTTEYVLDPTLDKIKTAAANVAMGGYKLTGVGTATSTNDAATLANKIHEFATPTAALPMGGQKITGVGTATSTNDAATLANKVHEFAAPTAALAMNGQKITGIGAATVSTDAASLANRLDQFAVPTASVSLNSQRITSLAAGVSSTDAASLSNKVHEFAAPTAALAMNGQKITGMASGSANTDAANIGDIQTAITAAATINLPTVAGNSGKFLTNNGTVASWGDVTIASTAITDSTSTGRAILAATDAAAVRSAAGAYATAGGALSGPASNTIAGGAAKGSVTSGTVTFAYSDGNKQTITNGGAHTWAFSGWPSSGTYGEIEIFCTNAGAYTITLPTINWVKGDGTTTTTFSGIGVTLQSSGLNHFILWTVNGGTTLYGRAF